ncbi:uncharacterized protein IL334_006449 [Kwoniella shivajii]|uniref:Mid2 domain-containing protein n=1 Tax=Kwoniella shivajii TaxID=564305 RepID=A0ABZ1D6N3_9TREE|nr:hypothetical protein IL334_006449 [Kwoniella shivajii]
MGNAKTATKAPVGRCGIGIFILPILSLFAISIQAVKQPYNISISDQSPMVTYYPTRSGPSSITWNVSYTESLWSNYSLNTIAQGVSSHYTVSTNANASLGFWGTDVWLWGNASIDDAEVKVDDTRTKRIDGGWTLGGLAEGWHMLKVRVTGKGGVTIKGVTFTTGIGDEGAKVENTTVETIYGQDQIVESFNYTAGKWYTEIDFDSTLNTDSTQTYKRLESSTRGSNLTFQPPPNTSFVLLYGSVYRTHYDFSVGLTSSNLSNIPSTDSQDTSTTSTSIGGIPSLQKMDGGSPWLSTDQVLYFANLHPPAQYTVNLNNDGVYLDLARVVYIQTQGGDISDSVGGGSGNKNRTNVAAIAGGVAGGIVVLALIAMSLWFFVFRKKRNQRKKSKPYVLTKIYEDKPFEIDRFEGNEIIEGHSTESRTVDDHTSSRSREGTHLPQTDSTVTPLLLSSSESSEGVLPSSSYDDRSPAANTTSPTSNLLSNSTSPDLLSHTNDSPRSNQERWTSGSRMLLHNPDQTPPNEDVGSHPTDRRNPLPPIPIGINQEARPGSGKSGWARSDANSRNNEIVQERDAGTVSPRGANDGSEEEGPNVVPPSYDPSWSRDRGRY